MKREMKTMDGNHAAAHVAYAYTDVAAIYPITPSTTMAEVVDEWAAMGRKNMFGETVQVTEMQSEAGAAGAVHGALAAGALTTTFTASQGLLLMIPNLYKMAGERLPGVLHVSARAIATHALSIFGDHSDIYACRQTGVAILCASSVQEVMDLAPVAHLAAVKGRLPVIHFFDGFRTSHEIQKIATWEDAQLAGLMDQAAIEKFRSNALSPEHPCQMGSAQNPDIFFQAREAANRGYEDFPAVVKECMKQINEAIDTDYHLFDYYGDKDAKKVIVAMGSVCETIEEAIDYLMAKEGGSYGLIKVRLYRPFCVEDFLKLLPTEVEQIYVLDRTKEPGAVGEPLYEDVVTALKGSRWEQTPVFGGRYGLGSKDTTPAQIRAVFENETKKHFTIGIVDDVTELSLPVGNELNSSPEGTTNCKFWGLGADGTVGANKNTIKIIGDHTDLYVQAYFDYDSKKSGGVTMSHLRFGKLPIRSTYLIRRADFVACHNPAYLYKYDMVGELKDGGTFLLNCPWEEHGLGEHLPGRLKRYLAEHQIQFYIIDAVKLGIETGMGPTRINTILQAAFFALTKIIPLEDALRFMKEAAAATYGRKGGDVVAKNHAAIDAGATGARRVEIPEQWQQAPDDEMGVNRYQQADGTEKNEKTTEYVRNIQQAVASQKGNELTVSDLLPYAAGQTPSGTAAYEKRGIAVSIPVWQPEKCIQCNICSYVCPHAVIRPAVLDEAEVQAAPEGMSLLPMNGMQGYQFAITVSALDCTGCGSCVVCCPAKGKAIVMENFSEHRDEQNYFDYGITLKRKPQVEQKYAADTLKGSQLRQPLLEFSGACGGCGETPYAKLVTQLSGERMYIANATGCSSIWGNSSPSTPYTVTANGKGPAWSNSLFEDAAEFGYGMLLAQKAVRKRLKGKIENLQKEQQEKANAENKELCSAIGDWLASYEDGEKNADSTERLITALQQDGSPQAEQILKEKDFLSKKSQWIFGGDGFAYDIGYGGLDHVLASGENINVLVFDTEVYSNTGGQASKATPTGAMAKFAAAGKGIKKKNLAAMAMSYGYVYVAQVAMGADYQQCVKAFAEAERYPGPSLIIAYAPCIAHGIKSGMANAQVEEKLAVEAGYWYNFRYHPARKEAGENPFVLDSKEPAGDYMEFLKGEVRYEALLRADSKRAERLFGQAAKQAKEQYAYWKKLAEKSS